MKKSASCSTFIEMKKKEEKEVGETFIKIKVIGRRASKKNPENANLNWYQVVFCGII